MSVRYYVWSLVFVWPVVASAQPGVSVGERFAEESLDYELGFFIFRQAADCNISFQREGAGYKASLRAKTKGFVGWWTRYRENRYVSYMEEIEGGRRLRAYQFDKVVIKGDYREKTIHWLDYDRRVVEYVLLKNDRVVKMDCHRIPEGVIYEDILSAFYNFRAGVFGPLEKGRWFVIRALPKKGVDKYSVEILSGRAEAKVRRRLGWAEPGKLLKILVSREIFDTRKGLIWVLMSEEGLPVKAVAEDAIGFGDITGRLVSWH